MERKILEHLKSKLMGMGYPTSSLRTGVQTSYGNRIDLVVYESNKPKIVFELKASAWPLPQVGDEELGFHPTVRQAQLLAQRICAPYFAVFDGFTVLWFDIDQEQGRPRLLKTPILPSAQEHEKDESKNGKAIMLRLLFTLDDIGRKYFELQEAIVHIGMALLARLRTETGDQRLEEFLLTPFSQVPLIDNDLSDLGIALDEESASFYQEAFVVLGDAELAKFSSIDVIDALDDFIQFETSREAYGIFKSPLWISELMANLAVKSQDDEILDIYSNFGDNLSAVNNVNGKVRVFSITYNSVSYLWEKLKRMWLELNLEDVIRIDAIGELARQRGRLPEQLDCILVAPPFGIRIEINGISHRSEELYLEIALDCVKPGGRVVAIVPENLLFSTRGERIRRYILEHAWIRTIISLEQFVPGTSVKASIVVLEKKSPGTLGGRVMMCRILEKDIDVSSGDRSATPFSRHIQKILRAYKSHIQNKLMPDEKGVWFVPIEALDTKSWAVDYYDPEREARDSSEYQTKRLEELVWMRKGSPLTLDKNGSLPVIGPGALRALSIDPTKLDRTTEEKLADNPVIAQTNDVLIHAVGSNRGQAAMIGADFENCFISRNIIVLHPKSSLILPDYLAIILNSSFVRKQLKERATGSVIRQLSIQKLGDLIIPVPDLLTQRLIAANVTDIQQKLVEIEQQALVFQSALKEQQDNLQNILDTVHLGGGENA